MKKAGCAARAAKTKRCVCGSMKLIGKYWCPQCRKKLETFLSTREGQNWAKAAQSMIAAELALMAANKRYV